MKKLDVTKASDSPITQVKGIRVCEGNLTICSNTLDLSHQIGWLPFICVKENLSQKKGGGENKKRTWKFFKLLREAYLRIETRNEFRTEKSIFCRVAEHLSSSSKCSAQIPIRKMACKPSVTVPTSNPRHSGGLRQEVCKDESRLGSIYPIWKKKKQNLMAAGKAE